MTLGNQETTNSDEQCSCKRSDNGTERAGNLKSFGLSFLEASCVLFFLFLVMHGTALFMGLPMIKVVEYQEALAQEAFGKHTVIFTTFTLIIVSAFNLFFPNCKHIENFRFIFQCILVGMFIAAVASLIFGVGSAEPVDFVFTLVIAFIAYTLGFFTNLVIATKANNILVGSAYLLSLALVLLCIRWGLVSV